MLTYLFLCLLIFSKGNIILRNNQNQELTITSYYNQNEDCIVEQNLISFTLATPTNNMNDSTMHDVLESSTT